MCGFGNDVNRDVLALTQREQLAQRGGADTVAGKIDLRRIFRQKIIMRGLYKFQHGARAEIGAADANDNQHIAVLPDALCSSLDTPEFLLIIIGWQRQPTQKVASSSRSTVQLFLRGLHFGRHCSQFPRLRKILRVTIVQTNTHCRLPFPLAPTSCGAFHIFV